MPQCAVVGCNNTHRRTKGGSIKYHRFPGDSGTRNRWVKACGKSLHNCSTARICSRHFSEESYERDVQHELLGLPTRCRLKRGAVPDRNLPDDFLKEEKLPESAIAVLLAVGLVPTSGLPEDLNKMQIMEDVREGCDANPPSSPGHAEQGQENVQLEEPPKVEAVKENGIAENNEESEDVGNVEVKVEQEEKVGDEDVDDKQEEENSNQSTNSESVNGKRKSENDQAPNKKLKTEVEDNFLSRDKIMSEFVETASCNSLEQIQGFSDQILAEIKTLNELAKEKEREWNQLLHMKKLKEELLIRLQRKRQVLIINDSDLSDFQAEPNNGQQSLLKSNQKANMLRELRAANLEKLKQRTNLLQNAYKQKPMLDVQSIIADYRLRHPETVPRRGRRIRQGQSDSKTGILGFSGGSVTIGHSTLENESALNGVQEESRLPVQHPWYRPGEDIKSYKDILLQFAKLSQSEKSELQFQLQNSSKPPPPYPEVTVHPVTSTSSVTPTNSLLHGILTKAPVRQSNPNGSTNAAINGGKSSFSPTLARLLTAPEKAGSNHIANANILSGTLLNPGNMSLSDIFTGNRVRNEITITPVSSQYETSSTKRESTEEESEDPADRLIIDEATDGSGNRKDDNRSDDGEEVPQCQGCNQKAAQFVCAGCGNQWYCSRDCQVAAWDDHSEVCSG